MSTSACLLSIVEVAVVEERDGRVAAAVGHVVGDGVVAAYGADADVDVSAVNTSVVAPASVAAVAPVFVAASVAAYDSVVVVAAVAVEVAGTEVAAAVAVEWHT